MPDQVEQIILQLMTATLGTDESGRFREVEMRVNVWKLQGERVQALVALIYGIVWLDKVSYD